MSKSKQQADSNKMMDRLSPEPAHGRLLGILATSYEMQPEFFETDFLPTLLGLGAWDDRNWTSRIALEKHLAELEAATVMVDARPYRGRPRSLRVEVEPVPLEAGRILHAKVLLRVYENAVRLIVGSANLTEPGYRRNREIVASLTATSKRPTESKLIAEAIQGVEELLGDWRTPSAAQLCQLAMKNLAEWQTGEGKENQWFLWGGGDEPLWRQVLGHWPQTEAVRRISIVSPFWSDTRTGGPEETFLLGLKSVNCLADEAELYLFTEAAPDKETTYKPKLPESFGHFDTRSIGVKGFAIAVDPRVPPEEIGMGEEFTGTRPLHAKVVLLEGGQTSLALLGSANFTNRGLGFLSDPKRANIEAGILLRRTGDSRGALKSLLPPTTGTPVSLKGAAVGRLAIPDQSPEELPWPSFIREIVLSPVKTDADVLELIIVVKNEEIAGKWNIGHLRRDDASEKFLLTDIDGNGGGSQFHINLDEDSLARLLRDQEVHVCWWKCLEGRSFPINVVSDARDNLPISPESGRPAEQHLIAYYQGRITWEDLYPDPHADQTGTQDSQDVDEQSGVDTSKIQSYIVREFVEALKGVNDDLKAAATSTKACMRLALLGSVSPVALAKRICEAAHNGGRSPTATGFQLVEILACLNAARDYEASALFKDEWLVLANEAAATVARMLKEFQSLHEKELSGAFKRYARTLHKHSSAKP